MMRLLGHRARVGVVAAMAMIAAIACETVQLVDPETGEPIWVSVSPATAVLRAIGATLQLTIVNAMGAPVTVSGVTWRTIEPGVVELDGSGRVTAVGPGTVRIVIETATQADTVTVEVRQDVAVVTVTPAPVSVQVGGTQQLAAALADPNGHAVVGRLVTWGTSAAGVATVSGAGLVTGAGAGTAVITATSDETSGTVTVTVTDGPPAPVATVTVTPATTTVNAGSTRQLTATLRDEAGTVLTGRAITWSSNAEAIATVNAGGLVAGHTTGSATITAMSEGVSGTAAVTVTPGSTVTGDYYVSPSGNDNNAGTSTAPFRTIQKAADVVSPGDVVIVEDGVWTDTDGDGSVVNIHRGGTSTAFVTFKSRNRWGAKLDGQNGAAGQGIDLNNGVGWVRIEGFEIYGVANVGSPVTGRGSASGIDAYDGGHDSEIVGNHIHNIGNVCTLSTNTNGQVAIFVQQPNITVEANLIHDIGRFFPGENGCSYTGGFSGYMTLDHGMYLNGGSPGADGTLIRNNVFYNTRHGWAVQVYPGSLSNIRILNNTFANGNPNKNYTSIVLDANISSSMIVNNVFYNPEGGRTIEAAGFAGTITIANNITMGTAMHDRGSTPSGMTLTNNQVNTNALFVNYASRDFRLQATSPAINAGQTLALVTIDFDGRLRPRGAAYDIGAFEY